MSKTLDDAVSNLFEATKSKTSEQIGAMFVEFVLEAQHGSWDGVPSKDKAAMGRFLQDLSLWIGHYGDQNKSSPVVYTGTQYMTADR